MTHSLTLGDLTLTGNSDLADLEHAFWFEVAAEGTEFGSPEAVVTIVQSLLSDGDLLDYSRDGNRTVPVRVKVLGPDLLSVARGEAALRQATKQSNELTWQPDDDLAPPSVYETYPSPMLREYETWDLDEKIRRERTFKLDLACSPYVRSAEMTVVEALPVGTTTVLVDNCNAETGWTATRNGVADVATNFWEAGSIGVAELDTVVGVAPETWSLTRTGSVDFTSTRFLVAQLRVMGTVGLSVAGVRATTPSGGLPAISIRQIDSNYSEVVFDAAAGGVTGVVSSLTFTVTTDDPGQAWQGLLIRNLSRSDIPPGITARQMNRILEVGGTERTPGSIRISDPDGTDALGLTLVSTTPAKYAMSGFDPAMSRWYVSGTRTADATTVSGYRFRLDDTFFTSSVPATSVPDGAYQMVSLMKATTAGTYRIESVVQTKQGGVTLAEWNNAEAVALSTGWLLVDLGVPTLPILRTQSGADVVLSVRALNLDGSTIAGVTVECQDSWFFPVDEDCGLTILQTASPYLWLDSPTVQTGGVQRIWEGSEADRSGSRFPILGVHTFGLHNLSAGLTGLSVVTSGVQYPEAQTTYYKRWLHNAAE